MHSDNWRGFDMTTPCPTCEALARTVMLDQTSHDTKREWVGLTDDEIAQCSYDENGFMIDRQVAMRATETKLKEKNG